MLFLLVFRPNQNDISLKIMANGEMFEYYWGWSTERAEIKRVEGGAKLSMYEFHGFFDSP